MSGITERDFGSREDAAITDLETEGSSPDKHTAMALFKGMVQRQGEIVDALDELIVALAKVNSRLLSGDYLDDVMAGGVYEAHNVAAQAVSVALTTTYTGLCISNPIGSKVNLVMLGCNYALSVAPAAIASLHLLSGYSSVTDVTHGTPLAAPGIQSCKVGAGPGIAKADSAATTVNPTYRRAMGSGFTAGALYGTTPSWIPIKPVIVVPPGGWIAWGALTAVTGFGSFAWKEVPV